MGYLGEIGPQTEGVSKFSAFVSCFRPLNGAPGTAENPVDFGVEQKHYIDMPYMEAMVPEVEWKKVSAEFLILSLVESRPRHGYEISKLIEQRSDGAVRFCVASLYPLLYRLERRAWIQGRWVERAGQRRRRYYRLTPEGRKVLASQRLGWQAFVAAVNRIVEVEHA
jgi:PadR family transcriptional regulator, regulatory protein PadR